MKVVDLKKKKQYLLQGALMENKDKLKDHLILMMETSLTINDVIKSLEKLKEDISGNTKIFYQEPTSGLPLPVHAVAFGYVAEQPGVYLLDYKTLKRQHHEDIIDYDIDKL